MKGLIFLLIFFLFTACNNNSSQSKSIPSNSKDSIVEIPKKDSVAKYIHHFSDTTLENRITKALLKLSFVKKANWYIDSLSNHQHGITFMLDSLDKDETEIYVQAGYNGDTRFETYYQFYVNPRTLEIKVYDAVKDKKLSVKEFLKTQN